MFELPLRAQGVAITTARGLRPLEFVLAKEIVEIDLFNFFSGKSFGSRPGTLPIAHKPETYNFRLFICVFLEKQAERTATNMQSPD